MESQVFYNSSTNKSVSNFVYNMKNFYSRLFYACMPNLSCRNKFIGCWFLFLIFLLYYRIGWEFLLAPVRCVDSIRMVQVSSYQAALLMAIVVGRALQHLIEHSLYEYFNRFHSVPFVVVS